MRKKLPVWSTVLLAIVVGATIAVVPIVIFDDSARQTIAMMGSTLIGALVAAMMILKLTSDGSHDDEPPDGRKPLPVVRLLDKVEVTR